ncbi:hypothetical protein WJ0W_005212 [Paenibacillus melissococcoides]|uniref:Uncharacterized protein n=1 Tax=Paenibacillus melissococcoides TaxID=2912268 RepID=A0ABM9G9A0_9BACL|nr:MULTISPECIES: hypothetical protein [Paenibacillus]MEB9893906.1 hypothetical protein [Bacillus cereus]CAH8247957.1 hypothetical protein WJ0W_005212 [Paenibacillus melissococcoides]CAH8719037.1 hypothetical protein HTL2_005477 [Paenibacillus melissococcoides]CAH8720045.1 hypothetical protein WDD9_005751 [Paenibacillus melissococcoides]GIO80875.1 hypothetical protein J6TS7_44850 [Paenibacillus dendritiformis]
MYYKLGVHAYTLSNHYECIDYCKEVLKCGESHYKADALGILIDAYFSIGAYKESELYLIQYKNFTYPQTKDNVVLMDTFFNAKKGNIGQAIKQLESFLETCRSASVIPATKQLVQLYLQQNNLEGAKVILENDKATTSVVDESTPLVCATYADYIRVKGEYYLTAGDIDKSITNMVESAFWYSKVDDAAKEKEALNTAMHIHLTNNVSPQFTLEKLSNYYQRIVKELEELA